VFKIPLPRHIANGLSTQATLNETSVAEVLRNVIIQGFKPPRISIVYPGNWQRGP